MANANPAMSMKTVSVTYHVKKPLGTSGATMSTFYNQTLKQADRAGVIRLDDHGKIAFVKPEVTINIPVGLFAEDIYSLELLKDAADLS